MNEHINKPFLLIAGDSYYPQSGTRDWQGFFKTKEEILEKITERKVIYQVEKKLKNRTIPAQYFTKYIFNSCEYDWLEIIDIREWIK